MPDTKHPQTTQLSVAIPLDLHTDLGAICAVRGEGKGALVVRLLQAAVAVEHQDPGFREAARAFAERQAEQLRRLGIEPAMPGGIPLPMEVQTPSTPVAAPTTPPTWTPPTFAAPVQADPAVGYAPNDTDPVND